MQKELRLYSRRGQLDSSRGWRIHEEEIPTAVSAAGPPYLFAADHQWILKESTLTYHVSHPLHQTDGVSHAARGKGVCHDGQCDFLIAVPFKTFDSGDSNRDLHMIQVTRGAEFPMVTVRTRLPESASASATVQADLEVQFAGQKANYQHVAFEVVRQGDETRTTGTIPATLTDFKIDPPSLLTPPSKKRDSRTRPDGLEFAITQEYRAAE